MTTDFLVGNKSAVVQNRQMVLLQDVVNGLYSGFPPCCVLYYCHLVSFGIAPARHTKMLHGEWPDDVEYVPCPDCLSKKNFVEVKAGLVSVEKFYELFGFRALSSDELNYLRDECFQQL